MDLAKALGQNPDVSFLEAKKLCEQGDYVEAVKALIVCVDADRSNHEAFCLLGDVYVAAGQNMQAVENYGQAVMLAPADRVYKQKLVDCASGITFKKINPNLKGVFIECLDSDDVHVSRFGALWRSIISSDPQLKPFYNLSKHKTYEVFKKGMDAFALCDGLIDPLLLIGLGKFYVPNIEFERWVTHLRRYFLDIIIEERTVFSDAEDIDLMACALLKHHYFTDYIASISENEQVLIAGVKKEILATDQPELSKLAILGCYEPLCLLDNAKNIAAKLQGGDHVSQIPKSQIEDYWEQQEIKKEIPVLKEISSDVSRAVQEQYEEFPYPRWTVAVQNLLNEKIEGELVGKKVEILNAGCGTGQEAVIMAYAFPDAQITAVDLSKTSLAYAILKARQLGLKNIKFMQADIMELGLLDKKFDYIASAGVLHHMEDPKAGWMVLNSLLKPHGLMRIALYSRQARWAINDARDVIKRKNIGYDAESIRAFRDHISDHLKYKSIQNVQSFFDYYVLPEVRDLLFHVQEHQFDLPQIKDTLDELGLEFLQFYLHEKVIDQYKRFNKKDVDAIDLDGWAAFEAKKTNTFAAMYTFWCRKK